MKKLCILIIGFLGLLSFGLTMTTTDVQAAVTYEVTFQAMFDAANPGTPQVLEGQTYNATIQFDSNVSSAAQGDFADYVFAFWVVNGVVRRDLPVDHTFTVVGDVDIIAVFSKAGENAVLFMDSNAKRIASQYVLDGANADDSDLTLPTKPGYVVSTSAKWSGSLTNITTDTVLTLQYQKVTAATFDLTVTYGTGTGAYNYNDVVTVTPNDIDTFSHWADPDGNILSTEAEYKFSMLEDKTMTAIFSATPEADAPRIILSKDLDLRIGYRSYLAQFHLPDGYKLIEYGILTLTEDDPIVDINTEGVIIHQGFKFFGETNEFIMSFSTGAYSYRAYLVVEEVVEGSENILHRYYSDLNPRYNQGPAPVELGLAGDYAILTKAGISTTTGTHIWGDLGVSPAAATYITGFDLILHSTGAYSTSAMVTGKIYAADYNMPANDTPENLTIAVDNMETAYTNAAGRAVDYTELHDGDLSGKTLEPGVYKWGTGVEINDDLTLDAKGDVTATWIFQITGTLTQASAAKIILAGGAVAENIVWQVTDTVTIKTNAHFEGTILCYEDVHLQTGATLNGRILSQKKATLDANKINE